MGLLLAGRVGEPLTGWAFRFVTLVNGGEDAASTVSIIDLNDIEEPRSYLVTRIQLGCKLVSQVAEWYLVWTGMVHNR